MKTLLVLAILIFPSICFSQSVTELFLQIPKEAIRYSGENVKSLIIETQPDLLKFRLSEARKGEFKLISQKKGESIVGMTMSNCDESTLQFWKIKKGIWENVTKNFIKPLGKNDVINILRVSPVSISKLDQQTTIATFYEFSGDSTNLKLIARKQESCEIAGIVYNYRFSGKVFEIIK